VRDHERLSQHREAHLVWTSITLMTRRLTQPLDGGLYVLDGETLKKRMHGTVDPRTSRST
jgi:hypothetical protein